MTNQEPRPAARLSRLLADQATAAQADLLEDLRFFFDAEPGHVRLIELSYFALSTVSYAFLALFDKPDREEIADSAALLVLESSIPHCGESISIEQAIAEYQARYGEYSQEIRELLSIVHNARTDDTQASDPALAAELLIHVYECALQHPAREHLFEMYQINPAFMSWLLEQFEIVQRSCESQ